METINALGQGTMHNLIDQNMLHKINSTRYRYGREKDCERMVLEIPCDEHSLNDFMYKLEELSIPSISERFLTNRRDGAICVTNSIQDFNTNSPLLRTVPVAQRTFVTGVAINLFTVTQDYTWRGKDTFVDGWKHLIIKSNGQYAASPNTGYNEPDSMELIRIVDPHLDKLQRYLLTYKPAYLNIIRCDKVRSDGFIQLVYTIEIARRYKEELEYKYFGREYQNAPLNEWQWQYSADYSNRKSYPSEITLWLALENVPRTYATLTADETEIENRVDERRLRIIHNVIKSEVLSRSSSSNNNNNINQHLDPNAVSNIPVILDCGNRLALLQARSASYQNGRARFPVIQAAVNDNGKLAVPPNINTQPARQIPHCIDQQQEQQKHNQEPVTNEALANDRRGEREEAIEELNRRWLIFLISFLVVCIFGALLYLPLKVLNSLCDTVNWEQPREDIIANSLTIMGILLLFFMTFLQIWLPGHMYTMDGNGVGRFRFQLREIVPVDEMLRRIESNRVWAQQMISFLVVCILGALLYLLNFLCDTVNWEQPREDIIANSLTIMGILLLFFMTFLQIWLPGHMYTMDGNGVARFRFQLREIVPLDEMQRRIEESHIWQEVQRRRIQVATGYLGQLYYDGDGLSFSGCMFTGRRKFKHVVSLDQLIRVGYTCTCTRDGREVLVGPPPHYSMVRLCAANSHNKVLFESLDNGYTNKDGEEIMQDELNKKVLPIRFVRGQWKNTKVYVGRLNDFDPGSYF